MNCPRKLPLGRLVLGQGQGRGLEASALRVCAWGLGYPSLEVGSGLQAGQPVWGPFPVCSTLSSPFKTSNKRGSLGGLVLGVKGHCPPQPWVLGPCLVGPEWGAPLPPSWLPCSGRNLMGVHKEGRG